MSKYFEEKELLEKRGDVIDAQTELVEAAEKEGRELNAEEQQKFDRYEEEYKSLSKRIQTVRELNDRKKEVEEKNEERADKLSYQTGKQVTAEQVEEERENKKDIYWKVMKRMALEPDAWRDSLDSEEVRIFHDYQKELRAQSAGTGSEGGFTVPEGFSGRLYESMKRFGGMRQASQVIQTASGQDLPWPTVDDTSNTGAILAENTQVSEQDVTFSEKTLNAYKYTSKLVRVSRELLQDSAFNMASFLEDKLGERIGRITNQHFTTGTGSSQPQGVVHAANLGTTTASSTAFTFSEVIDLKHSVDPAYRASNSSAYMFSDNTLAEIKKLSVGSSDARPLWQPSFVVGEPDRVDGSPYVINQDVDDSGTAGNQFMLYGDWSTYIIRDVLGIQLLALQERYADYFQIGYVAFSRHDGELLNSSAIKYMRHTTT